MCIRYKNKLNLEMIEAEQSCVNANYYDDRTMTRGKQGGDGGGGD